MGSFITSFSSRITALAAAIGTVGALVACSNDAPANPDEAISASPASSEKGEEAGEAVEHLKVSVKEHTKMIPNTFTQGLEVDPDGNLLVGTGLYGQSRLMRVKPGAEEATQEVSLSTEYFGEGIAQTSDAIWQLTWKAGQAVKRDPVTLEEVGRATYEGEGWGLCALGADKTQLIMSDGSSQLRHLDPQTFEEVAPRTDVTLEGQPVEKINELECVDGNVYANVWMSEDILRIDPQSGAVTAVIDASGLNENGPTSINDVLNGIAHIPGTNEYWITGKRWVDLYRVTFE
ncbi:TPA: glutaminyl-peptide cyclotransferase [Corynebacterium striatum]|uniref:glutaminyl-peptide cyclotransferase n=1 Tax=Corynebacterium striatum TaxID=43770 RepID=UPI001A2C5197|nr:glutaminyl-peptide cyclotransferase [Corynebacterium striatum]HAT1144884.1 glutaminyl-peptide cyclotransferase [Corynebacterium striatum]HAT1168560.1 glutaminyl-peptide cyclotransferase [Corynebacterium striatum]HAT1173586.1 glutaminyl-peptide cyclotransferase [Corynebacterium striatum]HAT1198860.1 glutaminyl-peptide cyclotransferase [Corynebacterium striatum]HAT1201687.1 glutaminyl-peptide cyclotransferase [Corynebacterium striatum]